MSTLNTLNLLSKFGNVQVKDNLGLSDDDSKFLERLLKSYDDKKAELLEVNEKVLNLSNEITEPHYLKLRKHYRNDEYRTVKNVSSYSNDLYKDEFDRFSISTYYIQSHIEMNLNIMVHTFYTKVLEYLSNTYNLKIKNDSTMKSFIDKMIENKDDVCYKPLVKAIKKYCGGVKFVEYGKQNVRDSFTNWVRRCTIRKTKNKLTINDVIRYPYIYSSWSNTWDYNDENIRQMSESFYLFENNKIGNVQSLDAQLKQKIEYGFMHVGLKTIDKVKIYKNGRLDIFFEDIETLDRFVEEFKIELGKK